MQDVDERSHPSKGKTVDLLTVASLGVIAFIVQNVIHEGFGHGGACVLVGGDPVALSTAYFDCDYNGVSTAGRKFVAAAGSLLNVATAVLFLAWLRRVSSNGALRLFLWLSVALGLLTGTGYLLFSGVLNVGDWAVIIDGYEPHALWRILLTIAGIGLYLGCIAFLLKELARYVGIEEPGWLKTAFLVTIIPYFTGSVGSTIGAFLNPISPVLIATSAAAAFGGASGLAWMTQMYKTSLGPRLIDREMAKGESLNVPRSWTWIGTAAILLVIHVFWLGPEIRF